MIITDPEQIKDIFNKINDFPTPHINPLARFLADGLASYEGEKWTKHRKLINPAFHLEKLKVTLHALLVVAFEKYIVMTLQNIFHISLKLFIYFLF